MDFDKTFFFIYKGGMDNNLKKKKILYTIHSQNYGKGAE